MPHKHFAKEIASTIHGLFFITGMIFVSVLLTSIWLPIGFIKALIKGTKWLLLYFQN